ncbi:putative sugar nucleotidyl transferase [Pirellulaceae bacterium SH467]|jgi:glucose-1-phosphate thymidylyltransferase
MTIVVFEDPQCELLAPITLARLAATVTCGSYRLVDFLEFLGDDVFAVSRPHLQAIQRIDFPALKTLESEVNGIAEDRSVAILLNARVAPTASNLSTLQAILDQIRDANAPIPPSVILDREHVAAVIAPPWSLHDLFQSGYLGVEELLEKAKRFTPIEATLSTIALPHELIQIHMDCIRENLDLRIRLSQLDPSGSQALTQLSDGLFVAEGATVGDYVLSDTRKGPIIVDRGAEIGPYTLLRGPIYIGPKSRILEHSAIKDAVSLCHTTKIGGEVEASIVEPYTNKQHHGFLGHSYLGSWINLGAGTCNSDLKNTYGTVNMEYGFGKSQTNMQFLGCIMGDYSKTAINTGIFTGKVIGVCSMMYGFVTSNVPSFVNYARLFGQLASLPPEVMVSSQQRMFSRRNVQQRGCDVQLIYDMYRLTQIERDRQGDALAL